MMVFWKIILQNPYRCRKILVFSATMSEIKANHQKSAIVTEIPDNFSATMTQGVRYLFHFRKIT